MTLEQVINEEAARQGFAAVGIAAAGPSTSAEHFRAWLSEGCAGDMRYLSRHEEMRADPGRLAPGVRSVIVVAARYPANPRPGGGFSTYARGRDYHVVLREKLRRLAETLRTHAPLGLARICVDSAPLPEREWAIRAGVGWRGRQGQIVHPEAGACLLLGELLVDVDLQPTAPQPSRCGDCRLCVDACPTTAIREDGSVDARRCISYLTIEHDGELPEAARRPMGEALFGCDCCTAVCPWNLGGEERVMAELRPAIPLPDAPHCLALTEEDFADRFRDTAVLRSGLRRLQRNAANATRNRCGAGLDQ